MRKSVLWRAVGAHQPRLADRALAASGAQAGRLEIRPGLLGAVATDRANIEPVGFGERLRHAGLDLRCKSGKNGEAGGDEGSDGDRRERFDHRVSPVLGRVAGSISPSMSWARSLTIQGFQRPSRGPKNGFVPTAFCFVRFVPAKRRRYFLP